MMCKRAYAVRIVEYQTSKGPGIVISFSDENKNHLSNATYYKAWAKGNRLYFIPSAPDGGKIIKAAKFNETNNTLTYYTEAMVEALRGFIGEYNELKYDSVCTYEYVDIADKKEAEVDNGSRYGKPKNKSKKCKEEEIVAPEETETEETVPNTDNQKESIIPILKKLS